MAAQKYCQVVVSWPVDDGRSVEDVVIYNIESDFEEGQIPSSTLDTLTDLFLSPPVTNSGDPGPPCKANVSVRDSTPGFAVAAVDVLSSARNVEVFSSTGEYLVLAEGTRLDVAGERKLFLSQHTFDQPQSTCDLKFVSLVDPQILWLHSLHVTLTVDKTSPAFPLAMGPSIDMDKVNAIISDMDADVPEQAKGLMSTMTSIQKNKERAMGNIFGGVGCGGKGPPTMASIMGMFASMGVTSRMPPVTPAPTAPVKGQPKPNQPTQGKAETDQNPPPKTKRHHKSGKKKNGGKAPGMAGVEPEETVPTAKQEKQKQNQPNSRPNSGDQSSQQKGKKQKDNNKKSSDDNPHNESSNKKKSGSTANSNNKNSASNSNSANSGSESSRKNSGIDSSKKSSGSDSSKKNSGSESSKKNSGSDSSKKNSGSESSKKNSGLESSKKNSGSDSAQSKKEQKASAKGAKLEQQAVKDTERSDSVDSQSPMTQADLDALEERILQRIDNAEEAIVAELTSRIEASEQRIMQHMEGLVSKMAAAFFGGGNMMNGSGRMDQDLTPD